MDMKNVKICFFCFITLTIFIFFHSVHLYAQGNCPPDGYPDYTVECVDGDGYFWGCCPYDYPVCIFDEDSYELYCGYDESTTTVPSTTTTISQYCTDADKPIECLDYEKQQYWCCPPDYPVCGQDSYYGQCLQGSPTTTSTCYCNESPPRLINYQGYLTDSLGIPITNTLHINFRIYDSETDGTAIWQETQTVTVKGGLFSVLLGSVNHFPEDIFDGYCPSSSTTSTITSSSSGGGGGSSCGCVSERWLSIEVASDGEMSPRQRIVPAPYSIAF